MKSSVKYVLCAIVGIALFCVGIFSTVNSIQESKEFKVYNEKYKALLTIDKVLGTETSAETKAEASKHSANFKKYFAISLLMYFADVLIAVFLVFSTSNPKSMEKQE